MDTKYKALVIISCVLLMFCLSSCTGCQGAARDFGGTVTIKLEPNQKLEEITWKDGNSLWYLTRPMTENDMAETHTFQESSEFGIFEGKVVVIESKK